MLTLSFISIISILTPQTSSCNSYSCIPFSVKLLIRNIIIIRTLHSVVFTFKGIISKIQCICDMRVWVTQLHVPADYCLFSAQAVITLGMYCINTHTLIHSNLLSALLSLHAFCITFPAVSDQDTRIVRTW